MPYKKSFYKNFIKYFICISLITSAIYTTPTVYAVDSSEPNNTFNSAYDMKTNKTISAEIRSTDYTSENSADTDYFKVSFNTSSNASVTITKNSNVRDLTLRIFDSNNNQIVEDLYDGDGLTVTFSGVAGQTYYFKVAPNDDTTYNYYFQTENYTLTLVTDAIIGKAPTPVAKTNSPTQIDVTWAALPNVSGYELYRSEASTGTYTLVKLFLNDSSTFKYTDTKLKPNTIYFYKLKFVLKNGDDVMSSEFSALSSAKTTFLSTAFNSGLMTGTGNSKKFTMKWGAISGATSYDIYSATSANGTYSKVTRVTNSTQCVVTVPTTATKYYKVKAVGKFNNEIVEGELSSSITQVGMVSNLKATSSAYNSIKLTWSGVTGATSYEIHRSLKSNSGFSKVGSSQTPAFLNDNVVVGVKYYYKVYAIYQKNLITVKNSDSPVASMTTSLGKPSTLSVSAYNSTTLGLSWSPVTGAAGYEVHQSTKNSGGFRAIKAQATSSLAQSGLQLGKTYYYKVRAYRVVNGKKVYSNFSGVSSRTVTRAVPVISYTEPVLNTSSYSYNGCLNDFVFFALDIQNNGKGMLTFLNSGATLIDNYNTSWNSSLNLFNINGIKVNSINVSPGKSTSLGYLVAEDYSRLHEYSTMYSYFMYDGKKYKLNYYLTYYYSYPYDYSVLTLDYTAV